MKLEKKRGVEILKIFNPLEAKLTINEILDLNPGYRIEISYTAVMEEGIIRHCFFICYLKKPFFWLRKLFE